MKTKRIFSVILSVALILSLANVGFAVTADGGSAPTYQAEALTGDNQISVAANYIAAAGASAISTVGNGGFPSDGDKNNMLDGNLDTWSNWNGIGDLGYMIVDLGEAKKMNAFDLCGLPKASFPTWYLPAFKIFVVNDDTAKAAVLNGSGTALISLDDADTVTARGWHFKLSAPVTGRYVILQGHKTQNADPNDVFWITHFAAANEVATVKSITADNKITKADNLLAGEKVIATAAVTTTAESYEIAGGSTENLTDGLYLGLDDTAVAYDVRATWDVTGWFSYDLKGIGSIQSIALNQYDNFISAVSVYVTNDAGSAVQANPNNYTPAWSFTGASQLVTFDEAIVGRYVTFKVTGLTFQGSSDDYHRDLFGVGELAAAGTVEELWEDGETGKYKPVTAMPAGSVLVGKTPYQGSELGFTWANAGVINDGKLAVQGETDTVMNFDRYLYGDCWAPQHYGFTYDMGTRYVFDSFLIGSHFENDQRMAWVKIYVGDNISTLYDEANLVADVKGLTVDEKNILVKPEKDVVAKGRYVGFGCYSSVDDKLEGTNQEYHYWGNIWLGELGAYGKTLTDYHLDENFVDTKSRLMGRQGKIDYEDEGIGRAIIALSEEELAKITGNLVIVGGDYGKETTVTLDCAYTYFFNGATQINATDVKIGKESDVDAAGFVIIDADGAGKTISGYGYYRLYKGSADDETNFLFDVMYKKPNN